MPDPLASLDLPPLGSLDTVEKAIGRVLTAIETYTPLTEAQVSAVYEHRSRSDGHTWRCPVGINKTWAFNPRFLGQEDAERFRGAALFALERAV